MNNLTFFHYEEGKRWADVDFRQSIIRIRQQLTYRNLESGSRFRVQRDIPMTEAVRKSLIQQCELSMLLGKGGKVQEVDGVVLQYIMGHTNISITLDVYTHLDFSQIQGKMEAVQCQENMKIG